MSAEYQGSPRKSTGRWHQRPDDACLVLTSAEDHLLGFLVRHVNFRTHICSVGILQLEREGAGKHGIVQERIQSLIQKGFVVLIKKGQLNGVASTYRLPWMEDGQMPPESLPALQQALQRIRQNNPRGSGEEVAPAPPPIVSVPPAPAQAPSVASGKVVPAHEPSPYEVVLGMVTKEMERTAAAFAAGKPERTVNISGIRSAAKKFLEDSLQKTVQPLVDETVQTDKIELKKKYSVAEYAQLVQYWRTLILTDWAGEEGFALLSAHIVGTVKGLGPTAHAGIFVTSMSVGVLLN